MPRRPRPPETKRSEHWLRLMVREYPGLLGSAIADAFGWRETVIDWRSPIQEDDYAEYYDQTFLDRLGVDELTMPLEEFWPKRVPRLDEAEFRSSKDACWYAPLYQIVRTIQTRTQWRTL